MSSIVSLIATIPKNTVKIPQAEMTPEQFNGILSMVFGLAGAVAVVFIVLGGMKYATSQGNAGDLQKGKDMIVYALVGLVIVIFAFTILQFVTGSLF